MKGLLLSLSVLLSFNGHSEEKSSERLKRQALRLAQKIEGQLRYSAVSLNALRKSIQGLKKVTAILDGDDFPSERIFKCISKDDDNRRPYIFSYKDEDFNIIKLSNPQFSSSLNCESSINNSYKLRTSEVFCASRDGDDVRPYSLYKLEADKMVKVKNTKFDNDNSCKRDLLNGVPHAGGIAYCTSRDGDNKSPFHLYLLAAGSDHAKVKGNRFSSLNECQRFLSQRFLSI